jgi:hypothetical protein
MKNKYPDDVNDKDFWFIDIDLNIKTGFLDTKTNTYYRLERGYCDAMDISKLIVFFKKGEAVEALKKVKEALRK